MEVSTLDSQLIVPIPESTALDSMKFLIEQTVTRSTLFRFLLAGAAKKGARVVDLGAGPCVFAKLARDDGYVVTAVDARTVRKPAAEELGSIRFVHSDVREFDVTGFDVIVCLGLFYHFDMDDQLMLLDRFVRAGVPVILETQIHIDALVPATETRDWARKVVSRGAYEGVVFPEGDNSRASIGNPESFWATEPSLLRMIEAAGFKSARIVDPVYQSSYGARRYFLLNCEQFDWDTESAADLAKINGRLKIVKLVNNGCFDEAREISRRMVAEPLNHTDWDYAMAETQLRLHFGEFEKAVATVIEIRNLMLKYGNKSMLAVWRCADILEAAHDAQEADKTRAMACDQIQDGEVARRLVTTAIKSGMTDAARGILAHIEKNFGDQRELLNFAAIIYRSIGDVEAAERISRIRREATRQSVEAVLGESAALAQNGNVEEAASVLENALSRDPKNPQILEKLVGLQLKLKRLEDAERGARLLISIAPLRPLGHLHLASSFKRRHRNLEALEHARRAAELAPGNKRYSDYVLGLMEPKKGAPVESE
jgi:tetratricopeptide (TPR) repeat protein